MNIVKKNLASIIFGVIAIVAMIALFWPMGEFDALKEEAETRASSYGTLNSLLSKPRVLPTLEPGATEPQPLTAFPSKALIEQGTQVTKSVEAASLDMQKEAEKLNRRKQLVEGALPLPDPRATFDFREKYNREAMAVYLPITILNSCLPPTADEIKAEADRIWKREYEQAIIMIDGKEVNKQQQEALFQQRLVGLPAQLREQRANNYKMYLDPGALTFHTGVGPAVPSPSPMDIWFAQLQLWIQTDVAQAIAATNAKSNNKVADSPVKHLIRLSIPSGATAYVGNTEARQTTGEEGGAPAADPNAAPPKVATVPTGRVSNHHYDVVHFDVVANVEADKVPQFIIELERNKLITVFAVNLYVIDSAAEAEKGYIYGPNPMVQAQLRCEAVFLRSWTVPLMPPVVKAMLRVPTPAPAAGAVGMAQ